MQHITLWKVDPLKTPLHSSTKLSTMSLLLFKGLQGDFDGTGLVLDMGFKAEDSRNLVTN